MATSTTNDGSRAIDRAVASSRRAKRLRLIERKLAELPKITPEQRRCLLERVADLPVLDEGAWR